VSCLLGAPFGNKVPSSGFCPPEMARALVATGNDASKLCEEYVSASSAYDVWSCGVLLFHLTFGRSLWHTNQDDSISSSDLNTLAHWTVTQRDTRQSSPPPIPSPLFSSSLICT
jgi:serine/threonine protein kinase